MASNLEVQACEKPSTAPRTQKVNRILKLRVCLLAVIRASAAIHSLAAILTSPSLGASLGSTMPLKNRLSRTAA